MKTSTNLRLESMVLQVESMVHKLRTLIWYGPTLDSSIQPFLQAALAARSLACDTFFLASTVEILANLYISCFPPSV